MNYMDLFSLKGKTCVITGAGKPHGIGFALADALACAGGDVVITGRNVVNLERNRELLRARGVQAYSMICENTDRQAVEGLKDFVLEKFGKIDVLVNNAAAFQDCKAEDMAYEDWHRVVSVNMDGNFHMSQVFGREMIRQGYGNIIFISSKSGYTVDQPQHHIAYGATKAALIMLTKSLAVEWAEHNIRVNCIAPGNISTDGNQVRAEKGDPYIDAWLTQNPMHRIGTIEECGNAAIYLASAASSYVTGETILIDGGYCAL
jgi:NAD(P)-dependent dehydrogenase (short-subunit alcohol dehydrogenase family)